MAWTETCKIDFKKQIEHKQEQGVSVREALKLLSKESEIPIGTLTNWMYPERQERYQKSVVKNDNTLFEDLTKTEIQQIKTDAERQMIKQAREIKEARTQNKRDNNLQKMKELEKIYVKEDLAAIRELLNKKEEK